MQDNKAQDDGGPTRDGPEHEGPDQPGVEARPLHASSTATRSLAGPAGSGAAVAVLEPS